MSNIFNKANGSKLRALVRASLLLITAFGLKLDPAQIGAIGLFAEAVLQLGVQSDIGEGPAEG